MFEQLRYVLSGGRREERACAALNEHVCDEGRLLDLLVPFSSAPREQLLGALSRQVPLIDWSLDGVRKIEAIVSQWERTEGALSRDAAGSLEFLLNFLRVRISSLEAEDFARLDTLRPQLWQPACSTHPLAGTTAAEIARLPEFSHDLRDYQDYLKIKERNFLPKHVRLPAKERKVTLRVALPVWWRDGDTCRRIGFDRHGFSIWKAEHPDSSSCARVGPVSAEDIQSWQAYHRVPPSLVKALPPALQGKTEAAYRVARQRLHSRGGMGAQDVRRFGA